MINRFVDDQIHELLGKIQLLERQQLDSIGRDRGLEGYLERNERRFVIRELLEHLQFLKQLREVAPKRFDKPTHPIFVEEKDRILHELSTLIQEGVEHIEDLTNPYAQEMYDQRKLQINTLFKSLQAAKRDSRNWSDERGLGSDL